MTADEIKKMTDAESRRMRYVLCSCGDALTQIKENADKLNAALNSDWEAVASGKGETTVASQREADMIDAQLATIATALANLAKIIG